MLPNNLDAAVTDFVGRDKELSSLTAGLAHGRLLSLTGVGGCGKSRLAAELCRWASTQPVGPSPWGDGVWWVDLGSTSGETELATMCAKALDTPLEPEREPLQALTDRLATKRLLLCLDTCEHLLDAAADLAASLLKACPGVQVLTTTREPLGVEGEQVWRVPSMSSEDATLLFLNRASLVAEAASSWVGSAEVAAICDRVDRLPLAIELAAAWTRVLSPAQLLADLDDRFRLLTGGARRAVPRHQALRASMLWSHNLLDPLQQQVFHRLAVFAGWFSLDAAVAVVVGEDGPGPDEVLAALARLVDKSLVMARERDGYVRYRLLDTVRQFAMEQLAGVGQLAAIRDRHLRWCLVAAQEIDRGLSQDQDWWRRQAEALMGDAHAALEWGLAVAGVRSDPTRRLTLAMTLAWFLTGHAAEGLRYTRRAAALPEPSEQWLQERAGSASAVLTVVTGGLWNSHPQERSTDSIENDVARTQAMFVDAFHWFFMDHPRCQETALRVAELAAQINEPFYRDFARVVAAYSLTARERHSESVQLARHALRDCRARGDRFCMAFAIGVEQYAAMQTGRLAEAVALGEAMVSTISPLGEYFGSGTLTSNLALALVHSGQVGRARRIMQPIVQSLDTAPEADVVGFQIPMGHACLREGSWLEASCWFARAVRRLEAANEDWTAARAVGGMVTALRQLGRRDEAEALLARGRLLLDSFDSPELHANLDEEQAHLLADVDAAKAFDLHHRALATRRSAGLVTFVPDSLDALCALMATDRPSPMLVRVAAATSAARASMGRPRSSAEQIAHAATLNRLRAGIGAEFDRAWQQGSRLSLREAVDLISRGRGRRDRPDTGWSSLTPAELDVARLVVDGLSNPQIGQRLFMSRSTVKTHLSRIYAKLAVSNRTELAAEAANHALDGSAER